MGKYDDVELEVYKRHMRGERHVEIARDLKLPYTYLVRVLVDRVVHSGRHREVSDVKLDGTRPRDKRGTRIDRLRQKAEEEDRKYERRQEERIRAQKTRKKDRASQR